MKKVIVYQDATLQQWGPNHRNLDYDNCVVINKKFMGNSVSFKDIFDILEGGDKVKTDVYEAVHHSTYTLKKGMVFEIGGYSLPHQQWNIYTHELDQNHILAFSIYSWCGDHNLRKYFIEDLKINSIFDLKGLSVSFLHVYNEFNNWDFESFKKAKWVGKVSSTDLRFCTISFFTTFFASISSHLVVKKVDVDKKEQSMMGGGNFHNCEVTVEFSGKKELEDVFLDEIMKKSKYDLYFQKENKIYLIDESDRNVGIVELDNDIIYKVKGRWIEEFLGKKLKF
jgi:hypothetical protein